MKSAIKILVMITALTVSQSCNKDFLKPKPLSFFAPENVYVNKAGFEAGLVTVRRDLKTDFYEDLSHMAADVNGTDEGNMDWAADWSVITPSSGTYMPILPEFGRMYGFIKNTNIIVSRIDDIEWDNEGERNAILAQAYFYRSYWYYRLVHTYGDVPFIGEELTGAKLDFFSNSRWAILAKIQKDLEFAAEWLPAQTTKDLPSKYAALQLLSKVYLVNLEFDKAIQATTTIINGPFALMTQRFGATAGDSRRDLMWDLHRPENKARPENTESIMIMIDRAEAPTGAKALGSWTMRNYTPWWWGDYAKDSRGIKGVRTKYADGTNTPQYDTLGRGNPDIVTTPWFNYTMWQEGGFNTTNTPDLRRSDGNWWDNDEYLYNEPTSPDFGKPFNPNYFSQLSDTLEVMYPFPQNKLWYPHEKGFSGEPLGGNGDMYVYRLAETYLIRAEAYFWMGNLASAASDINVVRQRANAVPINAGQVTIDYIFDERARELYVEEMRHTELVRVAYIMAKSNLGGYTVANLATKNWFYDRVMSRSQFYQVGIIGASVFTIQPYNFLWPIDINIITANTQGVINQNEGYEGAEGNLPPIETPID